MGSLATARSSYTAALLPSGQVLVAGGLSNSVILASAAIYDELSDDISHNGFEAAP